MIDLRHGVKESDRSLCHCERLDGNRSASVADQSKNIDEATLVVTIGVTVTGSKLNREGVT